MPKPKPDNRKNNVERLQQMVENTKENIEAAKETMANDALSEEEKAAIKRKNKRREESIRAFEAEIADEQEAREKGEI